MAQKNGAVNFLIHDANGQPQVIKVVQSTPTKQPISHLQLNSNTVKTVFKVPGNPEGSQQTSVYRTVKVAAIKNGSKLVQVRSQTIQALSHLQKSVSEPQGESPSGQQKRVQTQSVPNLKVIQTVPTVATSSKSCPSASTTTASSKKLILPQPTTTKRRDSDDPMPEYTSKRRKAADKVGKGLRHFSMKVCEKVRTKGFTSYNEVADELVAEFAAGIHGSPDNQYDQKNIRRRVYDALNVLMAMNIISKEKKEIRWLGLPTNSIQEYTALEKDKAIKIERIQQKSQHLRDLILQQILFKNLVERNRVAESRGLKPSCASTIRLPFVVVTTNDNAIIDCSISNDKKEYILNFDKTFQAYDDINILKRMGLLYDIDTPQCTEETLQKAKKMVPKSLECYVEQLCQGETSKMTELLNSDVSDEEDAEDDLDDDEEEEECGEECGGGESSDDTSSDVDVN